MVLRPIRATARVTCPPTALHYACHLAPWGLQSFDQSVYMHWNGHFAALLFINAWEYGRDDAFAANATYPLLAGLNDWWGCYLNRTANASAPGGYQFEDTNTWNPDAEHEGQLVPDPQIGLCFVARSVWALISVSPRRSRNSIAEAGGNLGAWPKPPLARS